MKPETPVTLTRDELKTLVHEAVRAAMQDFLSELKPLVKESVRELLQETNGSQSSAQFLSPDKFETLLNETSDRYKAVWKALA